MALKKGKAKKAKAKKITPKKIKTKKLTKKLSKKKLVRKKPAAKKTPSVKKPKENIIGTVTHYFPKVRVAVIRMKALLSVGDAVKIKGHTTDFTQTVSSMQIDRVSIQSAKKGQEIGLLVDSRVRQHDVVYKQ